MINRWITGSSCPAILLLPMHSMENRRRIKVTNAGLAPALAPSSFGDLPLAQGWTEAIVYRCNKAGANGLLAFQRLKQRKPNGCTLITTTGFNGDYASIKEEIPYPTLGDSSLLDY
jgi:hypothetical protein